jgi:phosphoenolpyruvate carboxylase
MSEEKTLNPMLNDEFMNFLAEVSKKKIADGSFNQNIVVRATIFVGFDKDGNPGIIEQTIEEGEFVEKKKETE